MFKIVILNFGDTSTKITMFEDEAICRETTIRHTDEEMRAVPTQGEQLEFRTRCVREWLEAQQISLGQLDAAVIRTVSVKNCKRSGTYLVNRKLREDIIGEYEPDKKCDHAGYLTLLVLERLLEGYQVPVYLVDPVYVDEFTEVARVSGHPLIQRESTFHALNQKAVARAAAAELKKTYETSRFVVCHMGGGISVCAHDRGRTVDGSNAGYGGTGPFSPTRTGDLPTVPLVRLCYSGRFTEEEMVQQLIKKGGFLAYTGLTDVRLIEENAAKGDKTAELVMKAFIYQVCKEIGAQCSVLDFRLDAILLTGGMAHSRRIVSEISKCVETVAPVMVYAGEKEAEAMAAGALRVLRGEEEAIIL